MIDIQRLTDDLIQYITSQNSPSRPISPRTNLLAADVLDSLLMMDLIAHVESTWAVHIEDAEIAPRHFRTVDCLVRLVVSKLVVPLEAGCLLCREFAGFDDLAELDAPSLLCQSSSVEFIPRDRQEQS